MLRTALVITAFTLAISPPARANMSGGPYHLRPLDINGGGTRSTSSNYALYASTGQAGGVGTAAAPAYAMNNGYIPATIGKDPLIGGSDPLARTVNKNSTCPGAGNEIALTSTDADSLPSSLTWRIKTAPTSGTVTPTTFNGANPTFCYQPNSNFHGSDSFVLLVHDGMGGSDTVTVNITVQTLHPIITQGDGPLNQNIIRNTTCPGASNQMNLSATDPDGNAAQLTWSLLVTPSFGTISWPGGQIGASVTPCYTPQTNYLGPDTYTVVVTDTDGLTDSVQINVTVQSIPPVITQGDGPIIKGVARNSTCPGSANQINLSATDANGPLSALSWSIPTPPAPGTAGFVGGNTGGAVTVCYAPQTGYVGNDSFTVRVTDGDGEHDSITINIVVEDAPTILSWQSIRTHGATPYGLTLHPANTAYPPGYPAVTPPNPCSDCPTVEPRRYGIQKIRITFSAPVRARDGSLGINDVTVAAQGWGQNLSQDGVTVASVTQPAANQVDINLPIPADNAQGLGRRFRFDVSGRFESATPLSQPGNGIPVTGDQDVMVTWLTGDVVGGPGGGDRFVDLGDVSAIRELNRAPLSVNNNFRYDVNCDGNINVIDMVLTMSRAQLNGDYAP